MRYGSLLLALAAALALAACGGGADSGARGEDEAVPAVSGPTTKTDREPLGEQVASRAEAPDIAGTTLDGKTVSLAELRGRPVFIKVFAGY